MRLFHGTDNPEAQCAFETFTLRGWSASNLATADGCEDHPFADTDQLVSLSQFRSTALRYAAVAVIEIEVADWDVYQVNSDEYVMSADADYEVVNVESVTGEEFSMPRIGGQH
jgi:hypothetical protein